MRLEGVGCMMDLWLAIWPELTGCQNDETRIICYGGARWKFL